MNGMIFVAIRQYMRQNREDALLRDCFPLAAQYMAVGDYPASDLVVIAQKIARRRSFASQRPLEEVLRTLGEAVPRVVAGLAPNLLPRADGFAALVEQIERGGNVAGRTLLPPVTVRRRPDGLVALIDGGPPDLCRFTEGLLVGHATQLDDAVAFRHSSCRVRGDPECVFVVRYLRAETTPFSARSAKR